jgi:hypothetical protein
LPIFPVIFKEKAAALRSGGEVGAAYRDTSKTVFRPGLAARGAAGVLSAAVSVGDALEHQLNAVSASAHKTVPQAPESDCEYPWTIYCQYRRHRRVTVSTPGRSIANPSLPQSSSRARTV